MMDLLEAIDKRHSVRKYMDAPIPEDAARELGEFISECNRESGLSMQLILNEPKGLAGVRGIMLKNASDYLAIVGKDDESLSETGGYYGEKVVLKAMQLGISSCWFAMGAKKDAIKIGAGEKLLIVIALGIGAVEGKPHKSKDIESFYAAEGPGQSLPDWFMAGIRAAVLAPTARNQQKFRFVLLADGRVKAESLGGMLADVDLGIAKYHFEIGAGDGSFEWA